MGIASAKDRLSQGMSQSGLAAVPEVPCTQGSTDKRRVKPSGRWGDYDLKLIETFKILAIKRIDTLYPMSQHCSSKLRIEDIRTADTILTRQSNPANNHARRNGQQKEPWQCKKLLNL